MGYFSERAALFKEVRHSRIGLMWLGLGLSAIGLLYRPAIALFQRWFPQQAIPPVCPVECSKLIFGAPIWAWSLIGGFLCLFIWMMEFAVHQRRRLVPQIKFDGQAYFSDSGAGERADGSIERRRYFSLRPAAVTEQQVLNCVAYIGSVKQRGNDGVWHDTGFVERQILMWGSEGVGDTTGADLDNETIQPLNVFYVSDGDPRIHPCIPRMLKRHQGPFEPERNGQQFRFEIVVKSLVSGGPVSKCFMNVTLGKTGDEWNDVKAEYEPG